MPEAAMSDALLIRAKRLAAQARAKRDNEGETQAHAQVTTALQKLDNLLIELKQGLNVHRALAGIGVAVAPLDGLTKPATTLRDQVQKVGRPTARFLTARSSEISRIIATMRAADKQAWRDWAGAQIDDLHEESLPPFGSHANQARSRIRSLREFSAKDPTLAFISSFKVTLDAAHDNVAAIREAVDTEDLKARIAAGGVTLADLSDEDLAELRADAATAGRIELGIR